MRTVHRPYAAAIVRHVETHEDAVVLSGDLTASCEVDGVQRAHPDWCFDVGMAEQNMLGVAGGMAKGGLTPFVHTFGVFATRRALDQVQMAVALPRARVRIMGFLPGLVTPGGPTHQAIDDVAIMRAVPGVTVLDLGDATEVGSVLDALDEVDGPAYCRVLRGGVPVLFDTPLELGRVRLLAEGDDLCLISSSVTTAEARLAVERLRAAGVSVAHLHASTLDPFDDPAVPEAIARTGAVITLENPLVTGGLGSAVAELIAEQGLRARLVRLGVRGYASGGSQPFLFERHGLTAAAVLAAAAPLLGLSVEADVRDGVTDVVGRGDERRQEAL